MTKSSVRIAELKAQLSAHLRDASRGHVITVLDRDQPIAQIVPYPGGKHALTIRPGKGKLRDIEMPRPAARKGKVSALALLLADRRRGR